jgi:hypothetical protein
MRSIPRKLAVLGLSVLAMGVMGVGAASAQAKFTVYDYYAGEPCPELVVEGNDVSGGCLIEDMDGSFSINSFGVPVLSYGASFDIRIDAVGKMYAVNQEMENWGGYPRRPCESKGEVLPWGGAAVPTTLELCIENPNNPGAYGKQVVPFYVGGNMGTYGYFYDMTQTDSPQNGIANAFFDNEGDNLEIAWEWES